MLFYLFTVPRVTSTAPFSPGKIVALLVKDACFPFDQFVPAQRLFFCVSVQPLDEVLSVTVKGWRTTYIINELHKGTLYQDVVVFGLPADLWDGLRAH